MYQPVERYRAIMALLFIIATGCPSEQRPQKTVVITGDSARIQEETTENSAWFFNVLDVYHRHTGPWFKVSSERQLIVFSRPGGKQYTGMQNVNVNSSPLN